MEHIVAPDEQDKQRNVLVLENASPATRRMFLKIAGATAAFAAVGGLGACSSDDPVTPGITTIDLGSGDTGILNYAYALEQLEAAFYTQVVASGTLSGSELTIFTEIRDHEIAHREFFKAAITTGAIPMLTSAQLNFSTVDFGNRSSILATAMAFEDLGVSAYNGAGRYLLTDAYLVAAGKIVSVEARHAAIIRDLMVPKSDLTGSFAGDDIVNASTGLDVARKPSEVLPIANQYLKVRLTATNLA